MNAYRLHLGCCLAYMATLPDHSIHFMLVDSPYANTDLAFDQHPVDWPAFWALAARKLTPTGVVVCFACESFTLDLIASNRRWYCYRRVWVKSKGSRYLDASWRPMAAHEDVVVFSPAIKSATYNPQKTASTGPRKNTKRKAIKQAHYNGQRVAAEYVDDGTRYPTTVMYYPSVGTRANRYNATAKPLPLVQELIETYTNPGDTVLEPFAGDAPAGRVCLKLGRRYRGAENNPAQHAWSAAELAKLARTPTLLSQLAA